MIDFDGLINGPALQTFGITATYLPAEGAAFLVTGIFDEAWRSLEMKFSRHGPPMPLSTTKPCFGCRASDFPVDVTPAQGDSIMINGKIYDVSDVKPDGVSGWFLITLN